MRRRGGERGDRVLGELRVERPGCRAAGTRASARPTRRTAGRTGRARRRPAPRRAGSARWRSGARRPCRRAPRRNASPSAIATSSTVWWVSMWRSPVACTREVEAAVAAELVEHVVVERHARRDVGDAACRRGRSSRSIDVSFVVRELRCRRARLMLPDDLAERGEERVVLLRRADGDAQAAVEARPDEQSRTSTLRSSSACHTSRPARRRGRNSTKLAPLGHTSTGSVGQARRRSARARPRSAAPARPSRRRSAARAGRRSAWRRRGGTAARPCRARPRATPGRSR